jgi:hypothetical protein
LPPLRSAAPASNPSLGPDLAPYRVSRVRHLLVVVHGRFTLLILDTRASIEKLAGSAHRFWSLPS